VTLADPVYRVTAVPSPAGEEIRVTSINSRGHIAGIFYREGEDHVFLYRNGVINDLGVVAGEVRYVSVNDLDEIVGTGAHAFHWRNGKFKDLTPLGVATARDINNRGQIVGRTADGYAYRYSRGEVERFGLPGDWSESWAINDLGQVTGTMNRSDDTAMHAFLYDHGTVQEIGPPYESYATTINERGQIGFNYFDDFFGSVAIYHRGVTSPRIWSVADPTSINNKGDLVGQFYRSFFPDPSGAALLYKDGTRYWLQMQIDPADPLKDNVFLNSADGINDRGQIIANGVKGGFNAPAESGWFFILTPVAQPPAPQAND
jgi:probable HAF family extracellular repeat protein